MTNLIIAEGLAQATLNYLSTQPYREVASLIQALSSLPAQEETPPPKAEDPKQAELKAVK